MEYRSTPNCTTDITPFEFLFARRIRTDLSSNYPIQLPANKLNEEALRPKIYARNEATNKKRTARLSEISKGSLVRIKLPSGLCSRPVKVIERWRTFAVLEDGKRWPL